MITLANSIVRPASPLNPSSLTIELPQDECQTVVQECGNLYRVGKNETSQERRVRGQRVENGFSIFSERYLNGRMGGRLTYFGFGTVKLPPANAVFSIDPQILPSGHFTGGNGCCDIFTGYRRNRSISLL